MVKQMTLADRRNPTTVEDIMRVMQKEHESGVPCLTRRDIAQLVERRVTPRLIGLIESLYEQGKLQRGLRVWPNGAQGYVYALWGDSHGE